MPYAKNLEHLVLPDKQRVKDAVNRVLYRQGSRQLNFRFWILDFGLSVRVLGTSHE